MRYFYFYFATFETDVYLMDNEIYYFLITRKRNLSNTTKIVISNPFGRAGFIRKLRIH